MARRNMRVAAVLAGAIMAAAGCAFDGATDPPVYIDQTTQGDNGTPNVPQPYDDGVLLTDPGLEDLEGALCLVGPWELDPIVVDEGTPGQNMPMVTIDDAARGTMDVGALDCRLVEGGTNPMAPSKLVCTTLDTMTLDEAARAVAPLTIPDTTVCENEGDVATGCDPHWVETPIIVEVYMPCDVPRG